MGRHRHGSILGRAAFCAAKFVDRRFLEIVLESKVGNVRASDLHHIAVQWFGAFAADDRFAICDGVLLALGVSAGDNVFVSDGAARRYPA